MSDFKEKLEPLLKMIEQLDVQTVVAICGVMLILIALLGGIVDVIAWLAGLWAGIALCKKFLC